MTFTANEGYQFVIGDTNNSLEYDDNTFWYPPNDRYVTIDNVIQQVKMVTQMKDKPASAIMHVKAYPIQAEHIPLTQNLTNCTSNFTESSVNPSTTLTITLTADTGYEFNSTPTYSINNVTYHFISISNTVYKAEFISPSYGYITISGTAIKSVEIPVTQNLTNCTSSFTNNFTTPNTSLSVTLTADNYCNFPEQSATYTINDKTRYFYFKTKTEVYADFVSPSSGTIVISANAIDTRYTVTYNLSHCTITPNIERIDYNENITFTVKANNGYKFDTVNPPYYTAGGIADKYRFTKVDDYTYTLDTDNVYSKKDLYIYATALQEITPPSPSREISYGFINIYLPTMEKLQLLSKRRFYNSDMERQDMFKYIYKVHKMYFNIPAITETTIALAYYRTGITCFATDNAFIDVNCGSVYIPELYHNIFDYQFTNSKIYLPFIGYQSIDTNNIMNSTVTLEYKANIVTGKTIAVLSTIERGELYQFEGYGGFDIPYMVNEFATGINHDLYQSSAYLGSFIPSIHLYTNIPYGNDTDNVFGYGVSKWCKIGDCTGYIRCQDIQLVITQNYITNSEMNLIVDLLKNGVFIN